MSTIDKSNTKKIIILASNNKHKIEEFKQEFGSFIVYSLSDINFKEEIEETGTTFAENSLIKAHSIYNYAKENNIEFTYILADDSGLCVDALGGAPGVYSARFAGNHDNAANRKKMLEVMKGKLDRTAHFTCLITLMDADENYKTFEGRCDGKILDHEEGNSDFGYNNLFYSDVLKKTFGNASIEERVKENHRGKAIEKVKEYLEQIK